MQQDLYKFYLRVQEVIMDLFTERLIYSYTIEEELKSYLGLVTNVEVMRYITSKPLEEIEGVERFAKILEINDEHNKLGIFSVYIRDHQVFAGISKVVPFEENVYEIGYSIYPEFWGSGYGTEISKKMVEIGRSIPGAKALVAIIDPNNIASRKILMKSGFSFYKKGDVYKLPAEYLKLNL